MRKSEENKIIINILSEIRTEIEHKRDSFYKVLKERELNKQLYFTFQGQIIALNGIESYIEYLLDKLELSRWQKWMKKSYMI